MNTMKWLIKREFWEHKGGFLWAPVVVGAIMAAFVAATTFIATLKGNFEMNINGQTITNLKSMLNTEEKAAALSGFTKGYMLSASPLMLVLAFVAFFFCLSALYDERKDRSVLFWKSLPVTDGATVLSKVAIALGVAPIITMAVATITALTVALLLCTGAAIMGLNVFGEVLSSPAFYLAPLQLAGMIPVYALWALPTVGWLLMVSAWARSNPFLWAVGVPLLLLALIAWLKKIFSFNWDIGWFAEHIIGRGLLGFIPGGWFDGSEEHVSFKQAMSELDMGQLLSLSWAQFSTPNMWIGVAVGAAMIYAAIRIRRWKDEG